MPIPGPYAWSLALGEDVLLALSLCSRPGWKQLLIREVTHSSSAEKRECHYQV